jgi:malonyl-CoA O-methyltransferase
MSCDPLPGAAPPSATSIAPDAAPPPEVVPTGAGYDRWSCVYDDEENPLIVLEEVHFPSLLGEVRGLAVADVGCGTGRHALRCAALGARAVVGLDFSRGMLGKAREKPGAGRVLFVEHDVARPLPLRDAAFDRAICALVLDHVRDLEPLFRELARIVRPGGRVAVSVMHPALMLRGVQARFTDPGSGRKVMPESVPNEISDYVLAALRAGLAIERMSEHRIDERLAARSPRLARYAGWPMLLLFGLGRP